MARFNQDAPHRLVDLDFGPHRLRRLRHECRQLPHATAHIAIRHRLPGFAIGTQSGGNALQQPRIHLMDITNIGRRALVTHRIGFKEVISNGGDG